MASTKSSGGRAAHQTTHGHGGTGMSGMAGMEECISVCMECHRVCLETAIHCLEMGGRHAEASHIRLLLDCTQICATSADFMIRGSDLHTQTCAVCAEVCRRCADECDRFDDDFMKRCAEVCRRCAESCRAMAGGSRATSARAA